MQTAKWLRDRTPRVVRDGLYHARRTARRLTTRLHLAWHADTPELGLRVSTAELVARQQESSGHNRMDLFVMLLALQESEGKATGGLALLERLIDRDSEPARGDRAMLAILRGGPISQSVFLPARPAVDREMRLIAGTAGLALAIHRGDSEVDITLAEAPLRPCYHAAWLRSHGFSDEEITRIEHARDAVFDQLGLIPMPWPERERILAEMRALLPKGSMAHGRGDLYQTCEALAIPGQRSTAVRFQAYDLASVLKPSDRVLDIGCNCGFFAIETARHVRHVDGFDISPHFIAIAERARDVLRRNNCTFSVASFEDFSPPEPYDVIFSFAVHHWIGMPLPEYAARLQAMLRPGGLVLMESQDLNTHDRDWDQKLGQMLAAGFEEVRAGSLCDDGLMPRRHVLLRDTRSAGS
jgi:2-polyprenyl-3-methyl-5-hydroxy-6-metoxy-1,4-benzoquinol methylase